MCAVAGSEPVPSPLVPETAKSRPEVMETASRDRQTGADRPSSSLPPHLPARPCFGHWQSKLTSRQSLLADEATGRRQIGIFASPRTPGSPAGMAEAWHRRCSIMRAYPIPGVHWTSGTPRSTRSPKKTPQTRGIREISTRACTEHPQILRTRLKKSASHSCFHDLRDDVDYQPIGKLSGTSGGLLIPAVPVSASRVGPRTSGKQRYVTVAADLAATTSSSCVNTG